MWEVSYLCAQHGFTGIAQWGLPHVHTNSLVPEWGCLIATAGHLASPSIFVRQTIVFTAATLAEKAPSIFVSPLF